MGRDDKPSKPAKKVLNERKGYVGPKVTKPPTAQQKPVPVPPKKKSDS